MSRGCLRAAWDAPIETADFCSAKAPRAASSSSSSSSTCCNSNSSSGISDGVDSVPSAQGDSSSSSSGSSSSSSPVYSPSSVSALSPPTAAAGAAAGAAGAAAGAAGAGAAATPRSLHVLGGADLLLLPSFSSKLASRLRRLRLLRAPAGALPLISCLGATLEQLAIESLHEQEPNQTHCWLCAASKP